MTSAIIGLFLVVLVGTPIAWTLRSSSSREILIGTSALCGSLSIAVSMMFLSFVRIPWSRASVLIVALAFSLAISLVLRRYSQRLTPHDEPEPLTADRWVGLSLDLILLLMVIAQISYVTIAEPWEWDFLGIWGVKGARFFEHGSIDWAFLQNPDNRFSHPDYPPLVPLNFAWLSIVTGEWNTRSVALIGSLFGGGALMIVRGVTRQLTRSAFLTAVMSIALFRPLFDTPVGLADGPLAALMIGAIALLTVQVATGETSLLPWLLVGSATLTKNEGLTFAIATIAVVGFVRRRHAIRGALVVSGLALIWQIARIYHGLHGDLFEGNVVARISRNFAEVFSEIVSALPGHPIVWLVSLLALGLAGRSVKLYFLPLLVAALQLSVYLGAYLVSPYDIAWHVETSWARVTLHVLPLIVFAAVLALTTPATSHRPGLSPQAQSR